MCTLAHLFSLPPVQDMLLEDLLPFDIARLLAATGCEITQVQRKKYMNPVRDVFDKHEEIALLTKAGVNIILLGHNAHLLHKRLNDTQSFVQKYGNRFEIDLIAIAYCHPDSSANAAHFHRDRSSFGESREPFRHSVLLAGAQSIHASVYEQQSGSSCDATDL
jgi:hypothetical protein